MRKIAILGSIVLLLALVGCTQVTYTEYSDGAFSVKYPEWPTGGSGVVAVQESDCQVRVNVESQDFDEENLESYIVTSAVPAYEDLGLTVDPQIAGSEAVLTFSGAAVGKAKYVVCENKLYLVSAGCSRDKPVIDEVIRSVSCAA